MIVLEGSRNDSSGQKIVSLPARAINQTMPDFVLDTTQIEDKPPVYNSSAQTVTAVVEWRLPYGFSAADVHGYASPAVYPLDCLAPEGALPLPEPVTTVYQLHFSTKFFLRIIVAHCDVSASQL